MQMSLVLGPQDCAFASPSPSSGCPWGSVHCREAVLSRGPPWRGEGLVSGCSLGWTIFQLC